MAIGLAALAALSAIPGALKTGLGIYQLAQANKYSKEERPTYRIPEEVTKATELARREAAQTGLPGEDVLKTRLAGTMAQGASALERAGDSPVDILAGISRIAGQQNRTISDVSIQAEQLRRDNLARFQQALGIQSQYEDKAFQVNKWEPYANAMRAAAMLRSSGTQNLAGGVDEMGSGVFGTIMGQQYIDKLGGYQTAWDMLKTGQQPQNTPGSPYVNPYVSSPYQSGDVPEMNPFNQ